jgi:hypothetical protein
VGGDLCCNSGGSLLAQFGNGKGEFSLVEAAFVGDELGSPLAGADFNHDGRPDLAVLGFLGPAVHTFLNAGHNTFTQGPSLILQSGVNVVAAGDFNNDGYGDLALLNGNEVDIYLGNGSGFRGPVTYKVGANPRAMVVRDLNGDGSRDLIVANHDSDDVSILLGKGDGSFEPARTFPAGKGPTSLAIGDFNRDGKLDLAVGGDTMQILLGRGKGEFSPPVSYPARGPVSFVAVADLRGNGLEDLLATSGFRLGSVSINSIAVLYGKGDGAFDPPTPYTAGFNPAWLAVGDFNSDGATDVAVVDSGGTALTLLLNQGGTRVALRSSSTSAKAGTFVTFTATVAAGAPGAGVPRGTLAFKDGSRAIGIVHLNDGRAVFSTAHLSKGKHTITASYWGDGFFNPHISSPVIEMIAP